MASSPAVRVKGAGAGAGIRFWRQVLIQDGGSMRSRIKSDTAKVGTTTAGTEKADTKNSGVKPSGTGADRYVIGTKTGRGMAIALGLLGLGLFPSLALAQISPQGQNTTANDESEEAIFPDIPREGAPVPEPTPQQEPVLTSPAAPETTPAPEERSPEPKQPKPVLPPEGEAGSADDLSADDPSADAPSADDPDDSPDDSNNAPTVDSGPSNDIQVGDESPENPTVEPVEPVESVVEPTEDSVPRRPPLRLLPRDRPQPGPFATEEGDLNGNPEAGVNGELAEEDPGPNVPPELLEPVDPWQVYRLAPLDTVVVQVFGYPDLSFSNNVDQGGQILVPLVGFLKVEGLTLENLQEILTTAYNEYVVDPEVLVTLGSQVNPDIVVSGEVIRPGFYRVGSFETVVQALISAGGVKDSADLRAVALRRQLPDGSLIEQEFNLLELLADGLPPSRIFLQEGDVVFVPRREVVNDPTYNFALATLNNLGTPTIRVRLLSYAGSGGLQTLTLPTGSSFIDALNGLPLSEVTLRKVALVRFEAEQGKVVTQELDGRAAIMGDLSQNPQLRDNDVIVVDRNLITKITVFFNRFTQPFRDVLGFLLFFRELDDASDTLFGPEGVFNSTEEQNGTTGNTTNNN